MDADVNPELKLWSTIQLQSLFPDQYTPFSLGIKYSIWYYTLQ